MNAWLSNVFLPEKLFEKHMTDILPRKNISLKSFKKILYGYISRSLLESMYSISSLYFHFPFIIIYLQIVSKYQIHIRSKKVSCSVYPVFFNSSAKTILAMVLQKVILKFRVTDL